VCVQALVQPLKFVRGTRRVWRCVLVSWLLAAIVAIPQLIVFVHNEKHILSPYTMQNISVYRCESAGYAAAWQRKSYFASMGLSFVIIPACIMIYCYVSIVRVVWLRAGGTEAAGNMDERRVLFVTSRRSDPASDPAVGLAQVRSPDHQRSQHTPRCHSRTLNSQAVIGVPRKIPLTTKRSVIKMAMSVTVGFMVCLTPYFVVGAVRIYSDYQYKWTAAKLISMLLALSHSAVNPFLYIIFSTRAVRAAFIQLCQRAAPRYCRRR